jgi:hypothetical protein
MGTFGAAVLGTLFRPPHKYYITNTVSIPKMKQSYLVCMYYLSIVLFLMSVFLNIRYYPYMVSNQHGDDPIDKQRARYFVGIVAQITVYISGIIMVACTLWSRLWAYVPMVLLWFLIAIGVLTAVSYFFDDLPYAFIVYTFGVFDIALAFAFQYIYRTDTQDVATMDIKSREKALLDHNNYNPQEDAEEQQDE